MRGVIPHVLPTAQHSGHKVIIIDLDLTASTLATIQFRHTKRTYLAATILSQLNFDIPSKKLAISIINEKQRHTLPSKGKANKSFDPHSSPQIFFGCLHLNTAGTAVLATLLRIFYRIIYL